MWSDKYYYLNIVPDLELSETYGTRELVDFLKTQKELTAAGNFNFKNSKSFPVFLDMQLLNAKSYTNWSQNDADPVLTNMIAVVCSKAEPAGFEQVKSVLIRIASHLHWQLLDERTDADVENYSIWKPR